MLTMILISIWLHQLKNKKVCFNTLLLLIEKVCQHNRFNLCYNILHRDTLPIDESNYTKLPETKDNLNKGKNG